MLIDSVCLLQRWWKRVVGWIKTKKRSAEKASEYTKWGVQRNERRYRHAWFGNRLGRKEDSWNRNRITKVTAANYNIFQAISLLLNVFCLTELYINSMKNERVKKHPWNESHVGDLTIFPPIFTNNFPEISNVYVIVCSKYLL